MSAWYSNILTTTTSRISNLRSTLLGGDADGDTEDDTHVCRVLRAYYTEKGRSFPQWLPPDPKAPPPPVATAVVANPAVGSRYGGGNMNAGGGPAGGGPGGSAALSSLWDNKTSAPPAANSLRNNNRGGAAAGGMAAARRSPFANNNGRNSDPPADNNPVQARPLPSQRLGSYQSTHSAPAPTNSAQDKLRNLFGSTGSATNSRSNSPALNSTTSPAPYGRGNNPYGAPPPPAGGGGGGGGGSDRKPFVAANAPWATDEYEYSQYGGSGSGGGGGASSGGRQGLPNGPRRGLPSGPRRR